MAQELLPEGKEAADYNQAVMDFGAMQCVPKSLSAKTVLWLTAVPLFETGKYRNFR